MVSESSQLSKVSPPFLWVRIHCWFCLQYGRWTSWVSGIFNSVSALPPHQLSAVWHPAAQWQRERTAKSSSGVRNPIPYACWEEGAESFSHCCNPYLFFSIFAPCLAQLWKMKYSNTPEQGAGLRVQSGAAEELGGAGTATGWAGNCSVTSAANLAWLWGTRGAVSTVVWRGHGVGNWSDQQQWWVATASPWRQSTPEPAISWAHLDEAEGFFPGSPRGSVSLRRLVFCMNLWNQWLEIVLAPQSPLPWLGPSADGL